MTGMMKQMKERSASRKAEIPAEGRILVCSPNWLGDTVMALPALDELRRQRSRQPVSILAKASVIPIWRMHGGVDEIFAMRGFLRDSPAMIREIRSRRFAAACILPHSARAALIPFLARVPVRSGVTGYRRGLLINRPTEAPADGAHRHQVFEYLAVMGLTGFENPDALESPRLAAADETVAACRNRLMTEGVDLEGKQPVVGLIPGAARGPSKRWPVTSFAELARELGRRDLSILVFGTAAEKELCASVAAAAGGHALDLAGKTDIAQLVACLALCRVVAANDSGGMHLAAAAGAGVVGIFGQTDPERTGPLGKRQIIVQTEGSRRSRRIANLSEEAQASLARVGVDRVLAAVNDLLHSPD